MPCHNGRRFLVQAIGSVLAQSRSELELLVVDNNSTDGSIEIARTLADGDRRVVPLLCQTPGAAHARNMGIQRASGRYIAFLDCDDWWEPEKLQRQVAAMQHYGAAMSWTSYRIVDEAARLIRDQIADPTTDYEAHMTKRSVIGCLTVVYDTALIGKVFMPVIRMRQDYALWARIIRTATASALPLVGLPEVLATYRVHDAGMTRNKVLAAWYQWSVYRDVEGLSLRTSLRYFWNYVVNAVLDRS